MIKTEITTKSSEETKRLGKKIAQKNMQGGVVCLHGDLGSGKTTFTQGFAEELGVQRRVNSPTFIIMRSYQITNPLLFEQRENSSTHSDIQSDPLREKMLYHLDLYRVTSERDIEGLGIREILDDSSNIVVIEWPEKVTSILPEKRTDLYFTYLSDTQRRIEIHENR